MKRSKALFLSAFLSVALSFALVGCYESKVPMKEKGDRLEPALLGHWVEVRATGDWDKDIFKGTKAAEIFFEPSEKAGEYAVRHKNSSGEISRFRVYIVEVDGKPADTTSPGQSALGKLFLNAQVVEGEPDVMGKYFFFRYDTSGDRLELRMVSDRFIKKQFGTSKELYDFIRENLENAKMYEEAVVFDRSPKSI